MTCSRCRSSQLVLAVVFSFLAYPRSLQAQEPGASTRLAAVEAVIDYRLSFLNDSSRYDMCTLSRALGATGDKLALYPTYAALLDSTTACIPGKRTSTRMAPIGIDSIGLTQGTGSVRIAVYHGEYSHLERYTLRRNGDRWTVIGVCLTAGSYADLRRPADTLLRRRLDSAKAAQHRPPERTGASP